MDMSTCHNFAFPNYVVEIQAEHWPDRLHKPRIGLVRPGSADEAASRIGVNRKAVGKIFHRGLYLGVSVGAHL